jgi:hypothetical protein
VLATPEEPLACRTFLRPGLAAIANNRMTPMNRGCKNPLLTVASLAELGDVARQDRF